LVVDKFGKRASFMILGSLILMPVYLTAIFRFLFLSQ